MTLSASSTRRPSLLSVSVLRSDEGSQLGCPPSQIPATSTTRPAAMVAASRGEPVRRRRIGVFGLPGGVVGQIATSLEPPAGDRAMTVGQRPAGFLYTRRKRRSESPEPSAE